MKPIGLVTCYYIKNYGSVLQAYATEKVIERMGLPYETIQCVLPRKYMKGNMLLYILKKLMIADWGAKKRRLWKKYYRKKYPESFGIYSQEREQRFSDFINNHFHFSKLYTTREELENGTDRYSAFLVGSDQLWRTDSVEHGYYTLDWVPDNIRKIAYSTSIGVKKIPWFQKEKNRKFMKRFDYAALREQSACDIFEALTGRKISVVLDPVLLLSDKEWCEIMPTQHVIEGNYIFCYLLGNNRWQRDFVKEFGRLKGLKIVALIHLDEYLPYENNFADETPSNIGPCDFINCIKNASYIFTDSFHCTAFSILFQKQFFTFNRFSETAAQSTNTRIDNLLNISDLNERRVFSNTSIEDLLKLSIDFNHSKRLIETRKQASLDYLTKALSGLESI